MRYIFEITPKFDPERVGLEDSEKLKGLWKIRKSGAPLAKIYIISPELYKYFKENKKFPDKFKKRLDKATKAVIEDGEAATIRSCFTIGSIKNPKGLPSFRNLERGEILDKIKKEYEAGEELAEKYGVEDYKLGVLLQARLTGERAGIAMVDSEKEKCLIDACYGDSKLIAEGTHCPGSVDSYLINKDLKVLKKKVREKEYGCVAEGYKLKYEELEKDEKRKPVLNDQKAKKIAKYAFKLSEMEGANIQIEFFITKEGRTDIYDLATENVPPLTNIQRHFE